MRMYDTTKRVESAWVFPLRLYSPVVLALLIGLLVAVLIFSPDSLENNMVWRVFRWFVIALIYLALGALGTVLFYILSNVDRSHEITSASNVALQITNEHLNTVLHNIGDGVISTDVDGRITLMNELAEKLTGWTQEEAVGRRIGKVFHIVESVSRRAATSGLEEALSSGHQVIGMGDVVLIAHDGTEREVAHRAAPLLDTEEWLVGAILVFRDVTEVRQVQQQHMVLVERLRETNEKIQQEIVQREEARRAAASHMHDAQQAQEQLKESEDRLKVLFEGIDDAILVYEAEGRILDCNGAACSTLGYPREELLKNNISRVRIQQSGGAMPDFLVTRDGFRIPVSIHTSTINFGGVKTELAVARDIAEIQRMQDELRAGNRQLRESNASLEEYARVASHDLQEPLRKIESFAQILNEDYQNKLDETGRHYLDIMVKAARRMRQLIKDVLALSRAGIADNPMREVNLNHVMTVVRDNLSQTIKDKGAQLVVGFMPAIEGDETQMVQLFQNLVGNGLKFNENKVPRVDVIAEENKDDWAIQVRDNGIGMEPSEIPRLFVPFKRLNAWGRYEGSGIGLAICRKIMTRHGGSIGIHSKLGKGSSFWLTFPKRTTSSSKLTRHI